MTVKINSGRQEVVAGIIDFSHADIESGVASAAMYLPQGAIVVGGLVSVQEAFNSGTSDSLDVGTEDDAAAFSDDVDLTDTESTTELEMTGKEHGSRDAIMVTWTGTGAAPTAGKVRIIVRYVVVGRAAFAHGPDDQATSPS